MFVKYNLLISLAFLSLGLAITNCSDCPMYWTDATHVGIGCLYFNTSRPTSWIEAQRSCEAAHDEAHLVEILNQEQQDYMVMKAEEISYLTWTGDPRAQNPRRLRNWWIGLTDEVTDGKFYWPYSLKEVNFTAWARGDPKNDLHHNYVHLTSNSDFQWSNLNLNGMKHDEEMTYNFPICQLLLTKE